MRKRRTDEKADPNLVPMNVDDGKKSQPSVRTASAGDGSLVNKLTNFKAMIKQLVYSGGKNYRVLIHRGAAH